MYFYDVFKWLSVAKLILFEHVTSEYQLLFNRITLEKIK